MSNSALRAIFVSLVAGTTAGLWSGKTRAYEAFWVGGAVAAGSNYVIGDLALKERNIKTQVVAGTLGYVLGWYVLQVLHTVSKNIK